MDNSSLQQNQAFLTSCHNEKLLGERLLCWQKENCENLKNDSLFSPESQATYDQLVKDLSQCLIAFAGCKLIASKLPGNEQELEQILSDNGKLGKWCLWHVDPWYIELIVERLMSLRSPNKNGLALGSSANGDTVFEGINSPAVGDGQVAAKFNAFDLIDFKIPAPVMGEKGLNKPWVCQENIAQIRNQETAPDSLTLTALSANQRNADTAAEFSKILEQELVDLNVDLLTEFAECYGIDVDAQGKFELSKYETTCFNNTLKLMRDSQALGVYGIASYAVMVLINFTRAAGDDASGMSLRLALGRSLQALHLPRNSDAFTGKVYARGSRVAFEKRLNEICDQQSGIENKKSPEDDKDLDWNRLKDTFRRFERANALANGTYGADGAASSATEAEALAAEAENLENLQGVFTDDELDVIREFLQTAQESKDKYDACYHTLCFIDWSKLERFFEFTAKKKPAKLSERTAAHFEKLEQEGEIPGPILGDNELPVLELADTKPNKLTDDERQQIENFVTAHRSELEQDRKLFSEWEKLQCPQRINCTEFISGLFQMLIHLSSEKDDLLSISLSLDGFKSHEEFVSKHNFAMCSFFSIMYGPLLRDLMQRFPQRFELKLGNKSSLDFEAPNPLTDFEQCFEYLNEQESGKPDKASAAKATKKSSKSGKDSLMCLSTSDEAMQIKFKLSLSFATNDNSVSTNSGILIWSMVKDGVGLMLRHDLELIVKEQAPLTCYFCQNRQSSSGWFKSLNLQDLSTLLSDDSLQLGAFIADNQQQSKLGLGIADGFKSHHVLDVPQERSLVDKFAALSHASDKDSSGFNDWFGSDVDDTSDETEVLQLQFNALAAQYVQAMDSFLHCQLTFEQCQALNQQVSELQVNILKSQIDNETRQQMLRLVQSIGVAYDIRSQDSGGDEFAIATPYNIQSMYHHMLHGERLLSLVEQMLHKRLFITKRKVVINALTELQGAAFGPEVIACRSNQQSNMGGILQAIQGYAGYTLYQTVNNVLESNNGKSNELSYAHNSLFVNMESNIDTALSLLERHIQDHPQLQERFNVLVYNCESVELLYKLYAKLAKSDFFSTVNLYLYVVNSSQALLSNNYKSFEQLNRQYKNRIEDQSASGCLSINILSEDEVNRLKSHQGLRIPNSLAAMGSQDLGSNGLNSRILSPTHTFNATGAQVLEMDYIFDVALVFHASDVKAEFNFLEQELPITSDDRDLFNDGVKCLPQIKDGCSNQFLVSPEQNVWGIVYLHALRCIANGKYTSEVLPVLQQLLQQSTPVTAVGQDSVLGQTALQGKTNTSASMPLVLTPMPNYELKVEASNAVGKKILYVHNCSQIVVTFDNLLTKKQLTNLHIDLVQYRQPTQGNTGIFVSTDLGLEKFDKYLSSLLSELRVDASSRELASIRRVALSLSGGLLMHAQLAPIYTGEMLGLILTSCIMMMVKDKLNAPQTFLKDQEAQSSLDATLSAERAHTQGGAFKNTQPVKSLGHALFMLDEYASWFGANASNIADILALNICQQANGRYLLRMIVAESKFCHEHSSSAAHTSLIQTKASAESFFDLFSHDSAICTVDRQLRLRQLISMLSQNLPKEQMSTSLQQVLLSGAFDVSLSAISCVYAYHEFASNNEVEVRNFTYGSTENNTFPRKPLGTQIIFHEQSTRDLLLGFLNGPKCMSGIFNKMLLGQEDVVKFLSEQFIVSLDAAPSQSLMRNEADLAKLLEKTKLKAKSSRTARSKESKASSNGQNSQVTWDASQTAPAPKTKLESKTELASKPAVSPFAFDQDEPSILTSTVPGVQQELMDFDPVRKPVEPASLDSQAASSTTAIPTATATTTAATINTATSISDSVADQVANTANAANTANVGNATADNDFTASNAFTNSMPGIGKTAVISSAVNTANAANVGNAFISSQAGMGQNAVNASNTANALNPGNAGLGQTTQASTTQTPATQTSTTRGWISAQQLIQAYKQAEPTPEEHQRAVSLAEQCKELSADEQRELQSFFEQHTHFAQMLHGVTDTYQAELQERKAWAECKLKDMIYAFKRNRMEPNCINYHLTPNGAVFHFEGNENFERDQIERRRESFKSTYGIVIDNVHAGVGQIDVSVQNEKEPRVIVPYLALCKQRSFNFEKFDYDGQVVQGFNSKFVLGLRDDQGTLAYLDLAKAAPHTLIAGGTGSGKSNLLNVLLLDMALTNNPRDLRIILMDPKFGAELDIFSKLPHVSKSIYNMDLAINELEDLWQEMNARLELFKQKPYQLGLNIKITSLSDYNKYASPDEYLPRLVVVIDEFADWFLDKSFKKSTSEYVQSLFAKSRAAGIHFILATQRPDKDAIDPKWRDNIGNMIALKTRDVNSSNIILGGKDKEYDASQLAGKGHMICKFGGGEHAFFAQSAFIDNESIGQMIDAICQDEA